MFSEKSPLFLSKVHRFLRKPVEFSQTFAHHLGENRRWASTSCGAALALALLGGGMLTACNDFLDVSPDSELNVRIDSEAKIAELLTGAYPEASYIPFLEPRTDNVAERPNGQHTQLNEAMYFWEDYDQDDLDTPLNYWNACYKGIAQANKALELLARYPKTPRVKALYGEAFLLRAYLHFMLVNIWAAPYGNDPQSPGIPYVEQPEKHAIVNYERGTVREVYDKIEADLKRGITLVDDHYYAHPKFHFNKRAAYAFASRFYLHKGDWDQVVAYADYVLGGDAKKNLRRWNKYADALEFDHPGLHRLYNATDEPANLLLTTTESRLARTAPTEKFGATWNIVDAVFAKKGIEGGGDYEKMNFVGHYLFTSSPSPVKEGFYMAKFDEISSSESTGSKPRELYVTNVLLTVDEVLLNRMEAYAMRKDYNRAIDDLVEYMQGKFGFMPAVERSVYTTTDRANYNVISPTYGLTLKQLALVKTILDFRRKEFFQEGLRWFDIRRFHLSVRRSSKSRYYFPLEKEDPRKLLQIPTQAIERGLRPNPRERNAPQR
jgi:hypothetical protein